MLKTSTRSLIMGGTCLIRPLCSLSMAGFATVFALTAVAGNAEANVLTSCTTYCHGIPPRDGARKGNPHFDSQSSAFLGNHRNHLPATVAATDCNICHTPVIPTDFGHQDGITNMRNSIKGYSSANVRAKYDKGQFFNQTSIPNLASATCSNVSCHFERTTPSWGNSAVSCATCHDSSPTTLSHSKHISITACTSCHTDHSTEGKPYAHATSAGRPIKVTVGSYAGSNNQYLPSQVAGRVVGSCTAAYCHSSAQGATGAGTPIYQSVTWGGAALNCGSCHKNMSTDSTAAGSHQLHATSTTSANGTGVNYTCQVCHGLSYSRSKTPVGLGGLHVNNGIELSFTTISGANAAGTTYSKGASFAPGAAYGQCSTSACHGGAAVTMTWGANTAKPLCFKCHGSNSDTGFTSVSSASVAPGGGINGRDLAGNLSAASPRVGAHQTHLTAADNISSPIHCGECHTTHLTVKDATHLNFTTATITFGPLAKTGGKTPTVSRSSGVISCSSTYCHSGNRAGATASSTTPAFSLSSLIGNTNIADTCTAKCHGMPPGGGVAGDTHAGLATSGSYTTPASLSACSSQTGGTGCHPTLNGAPTLMSNIFFDKSKHINGVVDAAGGHAFPYGGSVHRPGGTGSPLANAAAPYTNCTGCHDAITTGGTYPVTAGVKPLCSACHLNSVRFTGATPGCWDCHGASATDGRPNGNVFPNISGSHTKHVVGQGMACNDCHFSYGAGTATHGSNNRIAHNNVTFVGLSSPSGKFRATKTSTAASCSSNVCHANATWGTKLGCIDCHSVAITRSKGRPGTQLSAVKAEFGLAWGHKKTGRAAVKDADCIVCHLEGSFTTQKTSNYHMDGNIDLRDPDGSGETPITNIGGAAWAFQRFSTSYAAGTRTTTGHTSNTIDNIITQKFCLKCHDANGATNPTARSNNGGTGTQYMPFGGIALGANYTAANNAIGTQGTINVFSQFSSGNSSYHPVRAPLNRDFPLAARLASPYNSQGAGRVAAGAVKSLSVVINCFDCHNASAALKTTRTIVAHGAAETVRGTIYAVGAVSTLCSACHTGYTVTGTHGSGSAWSASGSSHNVSRNCQDCHGSYTTAAPARPRAAQDFHGNNSLPGGALWPTVNSRPYAFIRAWISGTANYHRPFRSTEFATGSATCGGSSTNGACPTGGSGGNVADGSVRTYSPGGSY